MKTTVIMAVAVLIVGSGLMLHVARTQQSGVTRTDLQRHELSVPGREVVRCGSISPLVCFFPTIPIRVKRSSTSSKACWSIRVEGKPPVTLKAGEVLFIPAGTIHSAKNVGRDNGAELATYIVEKGKPLVVIVK